MWGVEAKNFAAGPVMFVPEYALIKFLFLWPPPECAQCSIPVYQDGLKMPLTG